MTPSLATEYSENVLIQQPAIALFGELGWETADLFREWANGKSTEGRETEHEVILARRLRAALEQLNTDLPAEALDQAIEELTRDRSKMVQEEASHEVYRLLKGGVKVDVRADDGSWTKKVAVVIDWRNPSNNQFFLASEFWVAGDMYRQRCDLVGFVNGIPLLLSELKAVSQEPKERLRRQPQAVSLRHPAAVRAERAGNAVERQRDPHRQRLRAVGTFLRVEAHQRRGREGRGVAGDGNQGCLRAGAVPRHHRELHRLPRGSRRAGQDRRQEPSVPRREQVDHGGQEPSVRTRAGSACSGIRRAAARACR